MAALSRTLTQDELLQILDPNVYIPQRRRHHVPPPPQPATSNPAPSPHRRTKSIASSIASYVHSRAPSPRPSRPPSTLSRKSAMVPPLLALPPELLLYILELALPPTHTRATARQRTTTLYRLALVHPVLRTYAQGELFSTVFVTDDDMVARLARATCLPKSRGNALGRQVRTLRVNGNLVTSDGGKALEALVQQLKGLETLSLEDLDGLELRGFLVPHPALRSVSVTRCGFRSRFRALETSKPSSLTSLKLVNCTAQHDAFRGFTLPDLTHLCVWDMSLPPPTPMATLEASEAFKALAQQVGPHLVDATVDAQHLAYLFSAPRSNTIFRRTSSTVLQHLSLIKLSSLVHALDALLDAVGATLTTLHVVPPLSFLPHCTSPERAESHFASLVAPLYGGAAAGGANTHPALRALRALRLDWRYTAWLAPSPSLPLSDAGAVAGVAHALGRAQLVRLVERCSELGIDVRFERPGEREEDVYGALRRRGGMGAAGPGRGMHRWASEGATPAPLRAGGRFGAMEM